MIWSLSISRAIAPAISLPVPISPSASSQGLSMSYPVPFADPVHGTGVTLTVKCGGARSCKPPASAGRNRPDRARIPDPLGHAVGGRDDLKSGILGDLGRHGLISTALDRMPIGVDNFDQVPELAPDDGVDFKRFHRWPRFYLCAQAF